MRLFDSFKRLRDESTGVVAVEMAFAAIILTTLILGGFEAARALLLQQKLDRTAVSISDLVARSESLTAAELTDLYSAAQAMMSPFTLSTNGAVIISVIQPGSPSPKFLWQRRGGGTNTTASRLGTGTTNSNATMPTGFSVGTNEYVVVAEVYYNYTPLMGFEMFFSQLLYQASYNRPRLAEYPVLK